MLGKIKSLLTGWPANPVEGTTHHDKEGEPWIFYEGKWQKAVPKRAYLIRDNKTATVDSSATSVTDITHPLNPLNPLNPLSPISAWDSGTPVVPHSHSVSTTSEATTSYESPPATSSGSSSSSYDSSSSFSGGGDYSSSSDSGSSGSCSFE